MSARSGSLESLRELNRLRVVETLRERGTASRAEIARHTGLSRSTVSSLVADLQAHGLVVDHLDGESLPSMPTGRPPTLLALDRSAGAALGIDFGHDRIHAAVSDLSRTILAESVREQDVDNCAVEALDLAAVMVEDLLDEVGLARGDVIG
ncbi:MAG: winged helix-turn-helix domain-containing protein, partial [Actinomycetota bacterium]|nr:winged helix-turn-helix domain-containing protein [Actinomycetota bacterium]